MRRYRAGLSVASLLVLVTGCEGADPVTNTTSSSSTGGGGTGGGGGGTGGAVTCSPDGTITPVESPSCAPLGTDYEPRDNGSASDSWAACISDDNQYHPFDPNISSAARTAAFEQIATLLAFGGDRAPTPQDFLEARVAYTVDQGIESRVSRREDEHYPPAPMACRDLGAAEQLQYPDRCVGPVKIQPIINQAFQDGIEGKDPRGNAARIEAALLWFFYVSVHKEARTCAATPADCDSSYAYYAGDKSRAEGFGLSRYVRSRSQDAHDRVWDGILAVRCWRDLDNPTGPAADAAMQDLATDQLDQALLRGVGLIVRQRLAESACAPAWITAQILGGVLDREASGRDAGQAKVLRDELAKSDAGSVDVTAATAALDALFPCP